MDEETKVEGAEEVVATPEVVTEETVEATQEVAEEAAAPEATQ